MSNPIADQVAAANAAGVPPFSFEASCLMLPANANPACRDKQNYYAAADGTVHFPCPELVFELAPDGSFKPCASNGK